MNKKREVIYTLTKKDFEVQHYRGSGPGGQNRNKNSTAVRIQHPESGAVGECSEHKSQRQNKKAALERLTKHYKFKIWHQQKVREYDNKKTIEQEVEEMMKPENIKTDIKDENGKWVELEMT